ncbi:MAG: hypothetical protein GTO40_08280 [Deltaproteobacteria bacterium]|nr:hypothetical protein [Deltaproteobacteria bacterium]
MKFEVEVPSLQGIARVEIKTVRENDRWIAYLVFNTGRPMDDTCLLLGQSGIPHRFIGASEKDVEENAKKFLQERYRVARMIW